MNSPGLWTLRPNQVLHGFRSDIDLGPRPIFISGSRTQRLNENESSGSCLGSCHPHGRIQFPSFTTVCGAPKSSPELPASFSRVTPDSRLGNRPTSFRVLWLVISFSTKAKGLTVAWHEFPICMLSMMKCPTRASLARAFIGRLANHQAEV